MQISAKIISRIRGIKPAYLGFALFVALRFFYIHDTAPLIGEAGLEGVYVLWYFVALFLSKMIISLICAIMGYRNPLLLQRSLSAVASVYIGTAMLLLIMILQGEMFTFGKPETLLFLLGSGVLLGIGDGLMVVLWGSFSSTLSMRAVYLFLLSSYLVALLASGVASLFPPLVLAALVTIGCTVLPFLFKKSLESRPFVAQRVKQQTVISGFSKTWRYITLTALFAFLSSFTLFLSSKQTLNAQSVYITATLVTFGVVLTVLLIVLMSQKKFDIDLTYRIALPLAAGGLLLLGFLWNSGGAFADSMVNMGWLLSDLVTWCVLSSITARYKMHPFILFGINQIILSFAVILGGVGGYLFANTIGHGMIALMAAGLIGIYLLSMALIFLLKDRHANTLVDTKRTSTSPQIQIPTQEMALPLQPEQEQLSQGSISHDYVQEKVRELAKRADLTAREVDILGFLAQGRSTHYMAQTLVLSENTVKSHVKNVYRKLNVHSKQDVIAIINGP